MDVRLGFVVMTLCACGPGVVAHEPDPDSSAGATSGAPTGTSSGPSVESSGSSSSTTADSGDDDGPICVVGSPLAFCDYPKGPDCDTDAACRRGEFCDLLDGVCVASTACDANVECHGAPCHLGSCGHLACTTDADCPSAEVCLHGWCTMLDEVEICAQPWSVSAPLELAPGPAISALAPIRLPDDVQGVAIARGDASITIVDVSGDPVVVETIAAGLNVARLVSTDLIDGGVVQMPDLVLGGTSLSIMVANADATFDAPTPLLAEPGLTRALASDADLPHVAAVVDNDGEVRVVVLDRTIDGVAVQVQAVTGDDVVAVALSYHSARVALLSPYFAEQLRLDDDALVPESGESYPAEHPARAVAWGGPVDDDQRMVALSGSPPLFVHGSAFPSLVLGLGAAPNAVLAGAVVTDAGVEAVRRTDRDLCRAALPTATAARGLAQLGTRIDGLPELAVAETTTITVLR